MKRNTVKYIFLILSIFGALVLSELFLALFWPQKNIYLYEYKDGYVYNKPNFNDVFSFIPRRLPKEFQDFRVLINDGLSEEEQIKLGEIIGERNRDQLSRKITINSSGQRDDVEHNYENISKFRVLNLGDSMGLGWPVDLGYSYSKVMEKYNNQTEVINCSLINANTPMLVEIYKKDCSRYNPDLVVLQMTISKEESNPDFLFLDKFGPDFIEANIVANTVGNEYLRSIIAGRDKQGGPIILEDAPGFDDLINKKLSPKLVFYDNLNIIRLIENLLIDVNARAINFYGLREIFGVDDGDSPMLSFRYIEELRNVVEKNNGQLLVIIVPNLDGFYLSKIKERNDWGKLKTLLADSGYNFIDFSDIFEKYDANDIYVENEFHPNENGYRIIGEKLADVIEDNFLISKDESIR